MLPSLAAESIDACVTDPPYALTANKKGGSGAASLNENSPAGRSRIGTGFMGKKWDAAVPGPEVWTAILRVLKPGAHLLAFGGTRTHHRLMCAIEDSGFEIRDTLGWLYGSGFPKSKNIGGGRGTALKPAWEPIIMARKPLVGTVAANVEKHGAGALNIDACRVDGAKGSGVWGSSNKSCQDDRMFNASPDGEEYRSAAHGAGRWPANITHDGSEEVLVVFPDEAGAIAPVHRRGADKFRKTYGSFKGDIDERGSTFQGDSGSAARFFYCAKASREDRNEGLHGLPKRPSGMVSNTSGQHVTRRDGGAPPPAENYHPTVKPTDLMRWLCRLVTPPGGTILDPFMGSGSTGKAAQIEGFSFIGIELEAEYAKIAEARIRGDAPLFAECVLT